MTKIKILMIAISLLVLLSAPRSLGAEGEPSFHGMSGKDVSNSSLETALSNHGLDHIGHGLLFLAIVSFLALRKR